MLERIREGSQGLVAQVIIGLIILTFALAGIGSYLNAKAEEPAATVNGDSISQRALEQAYQNERARMESQYGEMFSQLAADAEYLKTFRAGILDRLIADMLVEQMADNLGLRVSGAQIKETILSMQEFQIDGQFNNDRYLALIRQAGFQASDFVDYMRRQMTRQQLSQALIGTEFSLANEIKLANALQQQSRDLSVLTVNADSFKDSVSVSDEEIQQHYQANLSQYDTEEQVSLNYVQLSVDDLVAKAEVTEQEVADYYQQNMGQYRTEEERRASHILIEFGEDSTAAKAEAEALLAQIESGEDFAKLAAEHSADIVTAENGGDLEWFSRGVMDPAFEEAAFALAAKGDVSDVIESAFGFHIIKLTDVKPEQVEALDDVRAEIVAATKRQKATEQFYNLQQRMSELAFEVPDNLEEVAAVIEGQVESTTLFSHSDAPELFNNPQSLNAAFSQELVEDGVNSEVLELSSEQIAVIRVQEHKPVRTLALEEVKADIEQSIIADKAQQAAKDWANELMAKLQEQQDINAELEAKSLSWQSYEKLSRFASELPTTVLEEAFKLATIDGQNMAVVEQMDNNVALVKVIAINAAPELEEGQKAALQRRLASMQSQGVYAALVESLKADADIEILIR